MSGNKVARSYRLPPDIAQRVDDWADENGLTTSEAYRRVIVEGIQKLDEDSDESDASGMNFTEAFWLISGYVSVFLAAASLLAGITATGVAAALAGVTTAGLVAGVSGLVVLTFAIVSAAIFTVRWTSVGDRLGVPA